MISPLVLDALACALARPSTSAFVPLLLRFRDGDRMWSTLAQFGNALSEPDDRGAPYYAARAVERAFNAEHWETSGFLTSAALDKMRSEAERWAADCLEDFGGTGATT